MHTDRRVHTDQPVILTDEQIGESALVWHVIEDAFWVVCAADSYLDDDFQALTKGQQHIAVLNLVWAGIMNGGALEPLFNSGGDFLPEAMQAADALGAENTKRLLETIVEFVGLEVPELRDQALRREALDRHGADDHGDLQLLVEPAQEWFECAERFIESNRGEFFA